MGINTIMESFRNLEATRDRYMDERFQQLNGLLGQQSAAVWTYLKTINGGGAVAMLAFIGAKDKFASMLESYCVLGAFVIGLSLVGIAHAFLVHKFQLLTTRWIESTGAYRRNQLDWDVLIASDKQLVEKWAAFPWVLGWFSFLFFLVGVGGAGWLFFSVV